MVCETTIGGSQPLPFLPLPSPHSPFHFPPIPSHTLEEGPLNSAIRSGERCTLSQQRLGQSPKPKLNLDF